MLPLIKRCLHILLITTKCLPKLVPSGRDPRLRGKVIQSTPFKKIYNKVYETNNTFVTEIQI